MDTHTPTPLDNPRQYTTTPSGPLPRTWRRMTQGRKLKSPCTPDESHPRHSNSLLTTPSRALTPNGLDPQTHRSHSHAHAAHHSVLPNTSPGSVHSLSNLALTMPSTPTGVRDWHGSAKPVRVAGMGLPGPGPGGELATRGKPVPVPRVPTGTPSFPNASTRRRLSHKLPQSLNPSIPSIFPVVFFPVGLLTESPNSPQSASSVNQ